MASPSSSEANRPQAPARSCVLTGLPFEILAEILSDYELDQSDRKELRLTCRVLEGIATPLVFRRVPLSKLISDRDAFLEIASRPHLAEHVREIVWYELAPDEGSSFFDRLGRLGSFTLEEGDYIDNLVPEMESRASNLFWLPRVLWLPSVPTDDGDTSREESEIKLAEAISGFSEAFVSALDSMPKLRTFISQEMPQDRVLCDDGYPITAGTLQALGNGSIRRDGLFHFLFPAMARPGSTVTSLYWSDHNIFESILTLQDLVSASASPRLDCLTSIDLCLDWSKIPDRPSTAAKYTLSLGSDLISTFSKWLHSAKSLQHLRLCHEHTVIRNYGIGKALLVVEGSVPWENLQTLALANMEVHRASFLQFVREHAHTLRRLSLKACETRWETVEAMAAIPRLKLDSLQLEEDDDQGVRKIVSELSLLRFVNKETDRRPWEDLHRSDSRTPRYVVTSKYVAPGWEYAHRTYYPGGPPSFVESTASSVDSEDTQHLDAPNWCWGRLARRGEAFEIYYWPVPQGTPGSFPTENWKFIHRSGLVSYGTEPLEDFEDWDREEGDVAEAVPFGATFSEFVKARAQDNERHDFSIGQFFGASWDLNPAQLVLPDGAVLYSKADDPFDFDEEEGSSISGYLPDSGEDW